MADATNIRARSLDPSVKVPRKTAEAAQLLIKMVVENKQEPCNPGVPVPAASRASTDASAPDPPATASAGTSGEDDAQPSPRQRQRTVGPAASPAGDQPQSPGDDLGLAAAPAPPTPYIRQSASILLMFLD